MTPGEKAETALRLLVERYGERPLKPCEDNLRQLIYTILSQRTTYQDEQTAFNRMWERFGSWHDIQQAPLDALIDALAPTRYPERKAPYIQAVLSQIFAARGEYSIDFLRDWETEPALKWLLALPGVGLKTATLVLLFCFHRPVMPVDTHVHRTTGRVGIIPARMSAERAHTVLVNLVGQDAHRLYNFHKAFFRHGQQVCVFGVPRCALCPLTSFCEDYQRREGPL